MMKTLKGFALALSMLTVLPFLRVHDFFKGINGYAVMFYPLVGLILGAILLTVFKLLEFHMPILHIGILLFGISILLTGALHLEGFADTVDGLFVSKERSLEVMKDPHNGGMGMIFSTTFLILKASSLVFFINEFPHALSLLAIVLMLSRFNAVLAIYFYPYVSKNGMGTLAKEELTLKQLLVASFYTLALGMWISWVLVLASLLVLFVIQSFFCKRYGGFTGDIYGFTIEVTELILINLILVGLW